MRALLAVVCVGALAFCAMATIVAYGCFSASLEHLEASRFSAVIALVPVGTLSLIATVGSLAPRDSPTGSLTGLGVLGAALVVVGSLATSLGGESTDASPSLDAEPQ